MPTERPRICIAGVPRSGKTTLAAIIARELGIGVRHTDDLIAKYQWSAASEEASKWLDVATPWIIEGVAVPRALRKWLDRNMLGTPCDQMIWLAQPRGLVSKGQEVMGKGCHTVWQEVLPKLSRRGVSIMRVEDAEQRWPAFAEIEP